MLDKSKIREIKQQDRTTTTTPLDLLKLSEKKNEEKINHEKQLLQTEQKYRNEVKNLTYNTIHDAIEKLDEVKQLIGDTRLQKPDITKMCAFRHKDGRILLGSIEHVTEAFKKDYPSIDEADLENLKANKKNKYNIERINIDEGLITILKDKGFKAYIAKRGMNGELENVGTLHGKWNEEKGEMEVNFEKYSPKGDQSNTSSNTHQESPIQLTNSELKKDDHESSSDDSSKPVEPVITIEPVVEIPAVTETENTETGKPEKPALTETAETGQGIHKEIDDLMWDIKLNKLQTYWVQRTMDGKNRQYLFDTCEIVEKKLNEIKDDEKLKGIKKQLEWMKESLNNKVEKYPQAVVKEDKQKRINFNQEISEVIKAFRQNLDLSEYSNSQEI